MMQRFCAGAARNMRIQNHLASSQFLIPVPQRHFGANEKQLKIRMKSVRSIGKITKAMKMVATSKMKGDLNRLNNGKEFGVGAIDTLFNHDTYMKERIPPMKDGPELLVPITSDKGLCGAINSGIVRDVRGYINQSDRSRIKILSIGDKGTVAFARPFADILAAGVSQIQTPYNYPTAMALSDLITRKAEEIGAEKVTVVYNQYASAISSNIIHLELMTRERFMGSFKNMFLYKMGLLSKNTATPALYDLYITSNIWVALLNNAAAEQTARMNAMENASKNAKEILGALTLKYNKARQARITTELVEIISGMTALE